jgi:hypothetical protein
MPFCYLNGENNASYEPTGEVRDGRRLYRVTSGFTYKTTLGGGWVKIYIDPGFISDLASIPSLPFFPKPGASLWDDAAIVHDDALEQAAVGIFTYAEADAIFYHALRDRGCSVFTAAAFWAAVRVNSIFRRKT